ISSLDSLMTENYRETSLNNSRNRELTFQADYVHPLTKKFILETGAKSIFRTVYSDYDYKVFDFPSDAYFTDAVRSNTFDYLQDVYAGYGQLSATVKKFGIKTGVRYEHTRVHGSYSQGSASAFSNDYDNWVPSATVSYTQQSKYTLKLSYTQRIQRPGFTYLNPYVNQSDSLNISYGNPLLGPEKSHAFELGWNWFRNFGSINTTVYHRFTNNAIEGIRFVDTNDVYVSTYGNIGENYSTGMSIGINVMWQMKIFLGSNFNMYYYKVKTENFSQHMMNDGINYNISFYGSYKFTKRWGVQAFGNFNGPRYSVQGKSTSFFYYNLSARWELKNEKGGIGLGLDNFASPYMNFRNEYKGEGFTYVNNNKVTFFGVRISFDYRFGKMDFSGNQKKKRGIRNDDLKDNGGDGMDGGMMGGGK
ncbi:MAG: TonB-dependent receptor family protein, partial [Bacteroidia bacterium]|nr:TonB-dependent receptor family protein [Bacteroidia bacterium]